MPILHRGVTTCEQCKKDFPWIHYESPRMRLSGRSIVSPEIIPEEQVMVHLWRDDGILYQAAANCPFCDYDNYFRGALSKNINTPQGR